MQVYLPILFLVKYSYFQFFAIVNNAATNIFIHVS